MHSNDDIALSPFFVVFDGIEKQLWPATKDLSCPIYSLLFQVRHVINFDFPNHMSDYIHRAGRVGRVGSKNSGHVTSFIVHKWDVDLVNKIEVSSTSLNLLIVFCFVLFCFYFVCIKYSIFWDVDMFVTAVYLEPTALFYCPWNMVTCQTIKKP